MELVVWIYYIIGFLLVWFTCRWLPLYAQKYRLQESIVNSQIKSLLDEDLPTLVALFLGLVGAWPVTLSLLYFFKYQDAHKSKTKRLSLDPMYWLAKELVNPKENV